MMNCTSCNKGILTPSFIEEKLSVHTCTSCKGNWILIEDFVTWMARNPNHEFAEDHAFQSDISETKKALICPVSGVIMTKFHISTATEHRLDYSAAVGGIWLDNGEWELLKTEGLADSLNTLVTREWQSQVRENNAKQNFSQIYQDKFGVDTYAKVKEFRTWLNSQPQELDLKAYLAAEDPYSAEK